MPSTLHLLERCLAQWSSSWLNRPLPPIRRVTEDVDVRTLERGHVCPNMGVVIWRGVWYPNLDPLFSAEPQRRRTVIRGQCG